MFRVTELASHNVYWSTSFLVPTSFLQMNYQRNYQNTNKAITCVQWSEAEQDLLMQLHAQFGSNWSLLSASYFQGRNPNQLKCKYNYLVNKTKGQGERKQSRRQEYALPESKGVSMTESKKQESLTESRSQQSPEEYQADAFDLVFDIFDFE